MSRSQRRHNAQMGRGEGGFTLIEVLVAMVVLGFALLGLFSLHSVALSASRQSEKMSVAAMLAKTQMEYLMTLPLPSDGSSPPADLVDLGADPTTASTPYAYLLRQSATSALKAAGCWLCDRPKHAMARFMDATRDWGEIRGWQRKATVGTASLGRRTTTKTTNPTKDTRYRRRL